MNEIRLFGLVVSAAIYVPVFYLLWVSALLILKKALYGKIKKVAQKTKTKLDDIFLSSLELPLLLIIFTSGIFIIENVFKFGFEGDLLKGVDIVFKATAIIAVILFFDKIFRGLIELYSQRFKALKDTKGVLQIVVRIVVIGLGILIILDNMGVSITPIIASLGIGSLAIALALQPTLENLFSGIQLIIDRPIKIGHFIKLESGKEGYVEKIGWRSTWVRMLPNNVVVIPNKVLVSAQILNYNYPQKEISVYVDVGVHYDSDLEHVEKVVIDVAKDVLKTVEGGASEFEPFIRYHTFNDSSIDFKVILRAKEFVDGYLIKHEFIKRLHKKFNEEKIVIPFPITTLDWNPSSEPLKVNGE